MSRNRQQKQERTPARKGFLSPAASLTILTAVTLLAFVNSWPDSLVIDDKFFVGPGRPDQLDSLYYIFTHDVWSTHEFYTKPTGLYRPLLLLGFSMETWVFGNWLPGYHLSNIFLHLLVTLLVFGFFRHLLRMHGSSYSSAHLYALLAALIFAVHPVHTEAVNSVFNRSDILVALFGVAGLWWLFHYLDTRPGLAWLGLGITYFLAMLSKENAVVIPGAAVILVMLLTHGSLSFRIRKCLPVFWLLLPLALYLALRFHALGLPAMDKTGEVAAVNNLTVAKPVKINELLGAAAVMGQSLKLLVWPHPLKLFHHEYSNLMAWADLVIQLILILASLVQLKRKHYSLAAGLAFFYLSMLPSSRLIYSAGIPPHVAERYVYFPSVGMAITLAFALRALAQRIGQRTVVNCVMPLLLVLTALTWDRNADWSDDVTLLENDYRNGGNRQGDVLRLLTDALIHEKNYARVVQICDENWKLQELYVTNSFVLSCTIAYEKQHRFKEAERAYHLQIGYPRTRVLASAALARFYVRQKRPREAQQQFLNAIDWSEDPADKAFYRSEMIVRLGPVTFEQLSIARGYAEEAVRLRPDWPKAEAMLKRLDKLVGSHAPTNP